MTMAKASVLSVAARRLASGGLGLALAFGSGGATPAAAGRLWEESADPVQKWLECRAAAARVAEVANPDQSAALPAGLTLAEREAMRARALDQRVARRLEMMDLSGRTSAELEALSARFALYYATPGGARRARGVLAACEAELGR